MKLPTWYRLIVVCGEFEALRIELQEGEFEAFMDMEAAEYGLEVAAAGVAFKQETETATVDQTQVWGLRKGQRLDISQRR